MVSPRRLALDKKLDGMMMTSHKEDIISMCTQEQDPACVRVPVGLRCKLCGRCSSASNADKLLVP